MEMARNLNCYGGHLQQTHGFQKYWVIAGLDSYPVLQVSKQGSGYTIYKVTNTNMKAFLAYLGPSSAAQARMGQRGEVVPRHKVKNKHDLWATGHSLVEAPHLQSLPTRCHRALYGR